MGVQEHNLKCSKSTLSKTDTIGIGTKCPSLRDVRLIESLLKGAKKTRNQTKPQSQVLSPTRLSLSRSVGMGSG